MMDKFRHAIAWWLIRLSVAIDPGRTPPAVLAQLRVLRHKDQ